MRPVLGARERIWLGASAFAALVGAHALTYLVAAPEQHARAELLHETGHGSWTTPFLLAGAALLAALVAVANRWASPEGSDLPLASLLRHAWSRLIPFQIVAFLGLETSERLFAHGSPVAALTDPVVLLGIVLQVVAAILCGLLLVAFTRLVRRLRKTATARHETVSLQPSSWAPSIAPSSPARAAWNLRGPPAYFSFS